MNKIIGFKFIKNNMKSKNGNITWKKGKWLKHEGVIELCDSGFHACKNPVHSLDYNYGDKWFMVEARGDIIEGTDKFVASEMRLIKEIPVKKVCVEFSIACAKKCLPNFEKICPDKSPRIAIQAAEAWLKNPTKKNAEIAKSAASSAAWSAVESARSAAWSAASSAWSAARSAESAARSAESAASSVEKEWQEKKLNKIIKKIIQTKIKSNMSKMK